MVALELACKFLREMFADVLKNEGWENFQVKTHEKTQKNNSLK
jgi:hypothetical protein